MMNLASKIGDGKGTVRKNLNRFSTFVKTGGEAYILGTFKPNVSESDKIYIIETNEGVVWKMDQQSYACSVDSPKKETKMKGKNLIIINYFCFNITLDLFTFQVWKAI